MVADRDVGVPRLTRTSTHRSGLTPLLDLQGKIPYQGYDNCTDCIKQQERSFLTLWTSAAISNLGDGVSAVALPLLAASLTRDPVLIAGVATAQRLPWLFFVLISGVIVDLVDRRNLLHAGNLLRGAIYAMLLLAVWQGWVSIYLLLCRGVDFGRS